MIATSTLLPAATPADRKVEILQEVKEKAANFKPAQEAKH
jgi:hypothetical protein